VDPGGERGDEEGLPLDDEGDEVGDEDPVVPVDGREEDSPLHYPMDGEGDSEEGMTSAGRVVVRSRRRRS
jgi:hypothetical protein